MKRYEIRRDGKLFADFEQGKPSRKKGDTWRDSNMLEEFASCVNHWNQKYPSNTWSWELRIILNR